GTQPAALRDAGGDAVHGAVARPVAADRRAPARPGAGRRVRLLVRATVEFDRGAKPVTTSYEPLTELDRTVIAEQLGRPPRAVRAVAARCPSGHPAVIETHPRLPDGSPFPTLYYLTCPRLCSLVGTLQASGL